MPDYQLAQLNVAHMKAPMDAPLMADFVARIEEINALADEAPGFVWRLEESGEESGQRPFGEDLLVNLSVWCDLASLTHYVYRSAHAEVMSRRREWFERAVEAYVVLWWVPAGHRPTETEAAQRLARLRQQGPGPAAFGFKRAWPPPDSTGRQAPTA